VNVVAGVPDRDPPDAPVFLAVPGQAGAVHHVAGALAGLGTAPPTVDEETGRVILPVAGGAGALPAVAGRLAAAGLDVSALALRRPTLEEAFLTLTGQPAGAAAASPQRPDAARSPR
jgi:hypothetical protein